MAEILTVHDLGVGQRVYDEMAPGNESKYGTVVAIDYSEKEFSIVVEKDDGRVGNYSPACFVKI